MSRVADIGEYIRSNTTSRFLWFHGTEWVVFGDGLRADIVDRIEREFLHYMTGEMQ